MTKNLLCSRNSVFFLSMFCAALATGNSFAATSTPKNSETGNQEMVPGYNQSARFLKQDQWDLFFGGSFIYWLASEDGLTIGRRIPLHRATTAPILNEQILYQEFEYKPGFKVHAGLGTAAKDDWIFYGQWTRLHQTTNTAFSFSNHNVVNQTWIIRINTTFLATGVSSSWGLHFDLLDFIWSRPCYMGTQLTLSPLLGIRTGWIDQTLNLTYFFSNAAPMSALFDSDSWGLGPLAGCATNWKLGAGFSVLGKASASILYTSYTTLSLAEAITLTTLAASEVIANYGPYRTVRPNGEIGLGLAWGKSFCKGYHVNVAATYDFNVFWNQNVLRGISDNYAYSNTEAAVGSLTLHGLTVDASLDF